MKRRHASALVLLTAALGAGSVTAGGTIRRIDDPARGPDLGAAFQASDRQLIEAVDRSLSWFDRPGSRRFFPLEDPPITHARARQSLVVFRELLVNATDPDTFVAELQRRFDLYESVGSDGEGRVLFTAYFAPEYPASRRRTPRFRAPIHRPPPGYSADATWHTRREIEDGNLLACFCPTVKPSTSYTTAPTGAPTRVWASC